MERDENKSDAKKLRLKAEKIQKSRPSKASADLSKAEMVRLIHQLEVNQIEVEMQQEELNLVNVDLTEQKEALKALNNKLALATKAGGVGIWGWDLGDNSLIWDDQMYRLYGLAKSEFSGAYDSWRNGLHPEDVKRCDEEIALALSGEKEFDTEFRVIWSDNSIHHIRALGNIQMDSSGNPANMIGTNWDITELKRTQENLELYRMMIEGSADSIFLIDDEDGCRMIYVNEAARAHFGKPLEEIYTWRIPDWDTNYSYEHLLQHVEDIKKIGHIVIESTHTVKDGEVVPVDISLNKIIYNGRLCHFGYFKDISERKKAEQDLNDLIENLNDKTALLESANKEMESFSYSVSHDLRAPLRAINSFSIILAEEYSKNLPSDAIEHLERISKNSLKMGKLIDELLAFARLGRKDVVKTQVNINDLVKVIIEDICLERVHEKAFFKVDNLSAASGDSGLLKQVLINLISNAYKYSRKQASPSIEIGSNKNENEITYYIKDNGVGFDMRYYDKLFGVFQRLHSEGQFEGTGIGLAIVQRIVTRHGGKVWAEAKVNKGACFYFTIPLIQS